MTRRKRPLSGILGAAVFFVLPAAAAVNISNSPDMYSWAPRAVFDSAGNLYVVWNETWDEHYGDMYFSMYTKSSRTWSTPENLSGSGRAASEGHNVGGIAVDDSDQVHVVWTEGSSVHLRTLAGGFWRTAETIGYGSQIEDAKIAARGPGDVYIIWWSRDGQVQSRSRVNGGWEGEVHVSGYNRRAKFSQIAAGAGTVMAVFSERADYYYQAVYSLRGTGFGSGWSSAARVAPESHDQIHPTAAWSDGATPHVLFCYENEAGMSNAVFHCGWTGNGFSSPRAISGSETIHYPNMDGRSGVLLAAWQVGSWGDGVGIFYNGWSNGQWGSPAGVPFSNGGTYCDVAIDPNGSAAAVWDASGEIMVEMSGAGILPPPGGQPLADFTFSPETGYAPLTVTFDASASLDADGTIVDYQWVFGDGETASGMIVSHTFLTPGLLTNVLTVIDNDGKTGTKSRTLEIINNPPTADFSITPPGGVVPLSVEFDGGLSSDSDGGIIQYDWYFSDGDIAQGQKIGRSFTQPGEYTVMLVV
ncbi:MAG: PKD domain-containing protein, partial [Candidatus Aminicenantes bacterium]|nr:PKD domain-containing protein [Candidatus Aminicenantes bacterium]